MPRKPLPPSDLLLTPYEAAEIAGVHHSAVRRWISRGQLRARRTPGGQVRIDRRDLEAVLRPIVPSSPKPAKRSAA